MLNWDEKHCTVLVVMNVMTTGCPKKYFKFSDSKLEIDLKGQPVYILFLS